MNKKSLVYILIFLLSSTIAMGMFAPAKAETWTDITLPYVITEAGNYRITEPWMGTGVALMINASSVAVDGGHQLIQLNQTDGDFAVAIAPGSSNVLLTGFNERGANVGVLAEEGNFTVQNSMFANNTDAGVVAFNISDFSVRHTRFSNNSIGLLALWANSFSVEDCRLKNNTYGVEAVYSNDFVVNGCYVNNNTDGLYVNTCSDFAVEDSTLNTNQIAILNNYSDNFTVNNCIADNNLAIGLASLLGNFTVANSSLSNNTIGVLGILCNQSTLANSSLSRNMAGMLIGASNITVSDSEVDYNEEYGMLIQGCNATVNRCNIKNNTVGTMSEDCQSFTLQDCDVSNNTETGLWDYFGANTIINSNYFGENGLEVASASGAFMEEDGNCTVTNNVFDNNFDALLLGIYDNTTNTRMAYYNNVFAENSFTFDFNYKLPSNFTNQQIYFYNNLVNDSAYVNPDSFTNNQTSPPNTVLHLNCTLQAGVRVYSNGPMIGGNYWAYPNGTGPSQTAADADHDGFADTPFDFFGNGTIYDYLPYSSSYASNLTVIAGASQSLIANQTSAKITVNFADYYGNLTSGLTINISSNSSAGKFYSNEAGTEEISTITIPVGSSAASFYYKDMSAGTPSLTASGQDVTSAVTNFTIAPHDATVDHITIAPNSAKIAAGETINYTTTAYDIYGNAWNVPAAYTVNGGVIAGNTVYGSMAGLYYIGASYDGENTVAYLTVTPGALDDFAVLVPSTATVGEPFTIKVVALDAQRNIIEDFTGTVTLSANGATINPTRSGDFVEGIWMGTVTVEQTGSFKIMADDGSGHNGTSSTFTVNSATKPTPSPSPTPAQSTIQATSQEGTVTLPISGNITSIQYTNIHITTDQNTQTTTITFTVTGQSGTVGLGNITIAKRDVTFGTTPVVYIDGDLAQDQGFTQDTENFYVWFTTQFSTHQVQVQFSGQAEAESQTQVIWYALIIAVVVLVLAVVVFVAWKRRKIKPLLSPAA